jgi:hypothetical protein
MKFVWPCHFDMFWSCLGLCSWEANAKLSKSILASSNGYETWWSCSWCQYEAIEYLTCSLGHVYHPMLNFVYLRSSRLKVLHFLAWFIHCRKGGEVWAWNGLLDAFRRFSGGFEPFLGSGVHRSDWSRSLVWPVRVLVLCTCWAPVRLVVVTGLTDESWVVAAALFQVVSCLHWFRGSLHVCRGSSLWFLSFGLVVCALCLSFVLSRMCRAVALA